MPPRTGRRFSALETTTIRDLQNSMKKLGATSLRVSPRDLLDPRDTGSEVVFDSGGKRYVLRCNKWKRYEDNLRAIERTIYYLYRAVHEYGAVTNEKDLPLAIGSVFGGFEAVPDDAVLMLPSGNDEWWEILGIHRESHPQDIHNAYLAIARIHHPDSGGDPTGETFRRLRRAYEEGMRPQSKQPVKN